MEFHIISAAVDLRIDKMDAQCLLLDVVVQYANQQLRTKIYPLTLEHEIVIACIHWLPCA